MTYSTIILEMRNRLNLNRTIIYFQNNSKIQYDSVSIQIQYNKSPNNLVKLLSIPHNNKLLNFTQIDHYFYHFHPPIVNIQQRCSSHALMCTTYYSQSTLQQIFYPRIISNEMVWLFLYCLSILYKQKAVKSFSRKEYLERLSIHVLSNFILSISLYELFPFIIVLSMIQVDSLLTLY